MGLLSRNAGSPGALLAVVVDATSGRRDTHKTRIETRYEPPSRGFCYSQRSRHVFYFPRPSPHRPGLYMVATQVLPYCTYWILIIPELPDVDPRSWNDPAVLQCLSSPKLGRGACDRRMGSGQRDAFSPPLQNSLHKILRGGHDVIHYYCAMVLGAQVETCEGGRDRDLICESHEPHTDRGGGQLQSSRLSKSTFSSHNLLVFPDLTAVSPHTRRGSNHQPSRVSVSRLGWQKVDCRKTTDILFPYGTIQR
jgi:hypothetical protein